MSEQRLYSYGLPFSEKIKTNIDDLKGRININKASLLIIDGAVGEGKTTLAVHIAEYYQGGELHFKSQYAFGGDDFQDKLKACIDLKREVIIYDEAGDFNKRGSLTRFNQMLNRVFETYRTFKILVILVLPSFFVLDDSLFYKQIPRLLLNTHSRTVNQGNIRGYSLYRMYHLRYKMSKLVVKPHAYDQTIPNFRGHFLDLADAKAKTLDKISSDNKKEILTKNILRAKGLMSSMELSRVVGMSKRWVLKMFNDNNIQPTQKFKTTFYYDEHLVNTLLEFKNKGGW